MLQLLQQLQELQADWATLGARTGSGISAEGARLVSHRPRTLHTEYPLRSFLFELKQQGPGKLHLLQQVQELQTNWASGGGQGGSEINAEGGRLVSRRTSQSTRRLRGADRRRDQTESAGGGLQTRNGFLGRRATR